MANPGGKGQAPSPPQRKIQIPENVSEFYSNSFNVGFTAFDFVLLFGSSTLPSTITVALGAQQLRGELKIDAVVRMSPQHAKASAQALQNSVAEWERKYGEIRLPEEVQREDHTP